MVALVKNAGAGCVGCKRLLDGPPMRMGLDPVGEVFTRQFACGDRDDYAFLLVDRRAQFETIEKKHDFESGVPDTLVAVDERVIGDQEITESCSLFDQRGIELSRTEGLKRLTHGGLQRTVIAQPERAAGLADDAVVQFKDLFDRKSSH